LSNSKTKTNLFNKTVYFNKADRKEVMAAWEDYKKTHGEISFSKFIVIKATTK
jgi:hypothetical protein